MADTRGLGRMALHVGIAVAAEVVAPQALEGLEHAAARLLGGRQVFESGLVGRGLLRAALEQERADHHVLAAHHDTLAGATELPSGVAAGHRAADHHADAEQQEQQLLALRRLEISAQRRRVRAGDVAGLMRDDADDLVRRVRLHQRFGVHEDVAAVHHERIERVALDDAHVDVLRFQAGGPEDRPRIVLQQFLDLGVADQADRLGAGRQHRGYGNGGGAKHRHGSGPQPSQEAPGGTHHGTETGNQVGEAFGCCHGAGLGILCEFDTGWMNGF